ncbi:MAG: site-specific DNA-methyltransferase [Ignavibacteriales bacterium]|nr:site-specific DNA-methyltransferase [Ignavibacteriales bacterium]
MRKAETLQSFLSSFSKPSRALPQAEHICLNGKQIPRYVGEFWTSRQRQVSSLHEISYRACFKAQLPRFFIEFLTKETDIVYDPFSGRGTTVLEAGLFGRKIIANDINPLSEILCKPRFFPPDLDELRKRLDLIPMSTRAHAEIDLSMFYHPKTEAEIVSLKKYLLRREKSGKEDHLDRWIRMVATNRLTGHSKGFFSVYTLPPNQAVSQESQRRINKKLRQQPSYRDTRAIILQKTRTLLRNITEQQLHHLRQTGTYARFFNDDAQFTKKIKPDSVHLTVTSPHFLDTINYSSDNWLRCWFNGIDVKAVAQSIRVSRDVDQWSVMMSGVFKQLYRITESGGWVAFEVGEVRNGTIKLEELVAPLGMKAGFQCVGIIINEQAFTKTSNIWGVNNNTRGTNSNRIVLFYKR